MELYRIYTQLDDIGGWHTAIYYDEDAATAYFNAVRAKHPDDYIITEVLDDDDGEIIKQKEFNKPVDIDIDTVKALRQEYVSLYRYDVTWKEERLVRENISPAVASQYMVYAAGEEGYGTEWVYTIKPCNFVNHITDD